MCFACYVLMRLFVWCGRAQSTPTGARERRRGGEEGGDGVRESVSLRVCVFVCFFSLLLFS